MRFIAKTLLLAFLGATFAYTQQGTIQHIIVVVQENRTPDNLFQDQNLINAGADIVPISTGGLCGKTTSVALNPRPLADCANPNHNHNVGWLPSYDGGKMDGACTTTVGYGFPCPPSVGPYMCPQPNSKNATDCTEYAYVSDPAIRPYWDIAEKYGYANYMFQTSQGPSFPAHQFLLSGSSQPEAWGIPFYTYFAAENMDSGLTQDAGCDAASGETVRIVSPTQDESTKVPPCFEHATLTDLLDQNNITWRYYSDQPKSIWTAPNAITHICNEGSGGCGTGTGSNTDWNNNVKPYLERTPRGNPPTPTLAPFLYDVQHCDLKQVTWVVPDGRWSDHPTENFGLGPDYVADIVNAVGQGGCADGEVPYWHDTVILIVWDDWGGWYDHIVPPDCTTGTCTGYHGGNGNGQQYVYGFRVPLLVVSAYLKQTSQTYTGYISGKIGSPINYDFGSILKFIEETFLPGNTVGINPIYPYADQFVTQNVNDLSDFFQCFTQACQNAFQPIALAANPQYCNNNTGGCGQTSCNAACFINYPGSPRDPDDE